MIREPQRTHLLELLNALKTAAGDFVVVGAQAMRFALQHPRTTRDVDFLLDVANLRDKPVQLSPLLKGLGYSVVNSARNFQFEKPIPNSKEIMRIEFMAPDEFKRGNDFRVDVQHGVHARACTGGSTALAQSETYEVPGLLPDGTAFTGPVRVVRSHALVMLKLLALDDRYRNIRGPSEALHDRDEARIHTADIVAILNAQRVDRFKQDFQDQFGSNLALGLRTFEILHAYFREGIFKGAQLYEEFLAADTPMTRNHQRDLKQVVDRAHKLISRLVPDRAFFLLLEITRDSCDFGRNRGLVEEFLSSLERKGISISDQRALGELPPYLGEAFGRGSTFLAGDAIQRLTAIEKRMVQHCLGEQTVALKQNSELKKKFPVALERAGV